MSDFLAILLFITCFLFAISTLLSIYLDVCCELNTNFIYRYKSDNNDSD